MTEDQHQAAVIKWSQQASIRKKYPVLALLHHIPNERQCTPRQGAKLKRMGVKSGVPDLFLPAPRGAYHGLYLEMKTENGRTSDNQNWWLKNLEGVGYHCKVCHGWKEAVQEMERYLNL